MFPGVIQSVLTGNIMPNALVKLSTFGLDRWLDLNVGAFGEDRRVRADLVPVAQSRAAERYGFDAGRSVTVLIGDTRLDVRAGLDGGARVVGVATGVATTDELKDAGADAVLADLSDVAGLLAALDLVAALGPVSRPAAGTPNGR